MVNIICMKWGTKYSAEYVNKLQRMVARNLSLPHRFICLTDNGAGVNESVETFAIPDIGIDLNGPERGWNKLVTFSASLYDLSGACLFLDLDLLIVGSLDELFAQLGDVLIIRDWLKKDGTGNSSVYRFTLGAHADLLADFQTNADAIKKRYRNEQEYLSAYLLGKNALGYWPDSWCRSYKRHCLHNFPMSLFKIPAVPTGAKVIVFHGHPNPDDAILGKTRKWYRFARPAKWIETLWN